MCPGLRPLTSAYLIGQLIFHYNSVHFVKSVFVFVQELLKQLIGHF